MKKTYISPLTEAVATDMAEIICTSIAEGGSAAEGGIVSGDSRMAADDFFNDDEPF